MFANLSRNQRILLAALAAWSLVLFGVMHRCVRLVIADPAPDATYIEELNALALNAGPDRENAAYVLAEATAALNEIDNSLGIRLGREAERGLRGTITGARHDTLDLAQPVFEILEKLDDCTHLSVQRTRTGVPEPFIDRDQIKAIYALYGYAIHQSRDARSYPPIYDWQQVEILFRRSLHLASLAERSVDPDIRRSFTGAVVATCWTVRTIICWNIITREGCERVLGVLMDYEQLLEPTEAQRRAHWIHLRAGVRASHSADGLPIHWTERHPDGLPFLSDASESSASTSTRLDAVRSLLRPSFEFRSQSIDTHIATAQSSSGLNPPDLDHTLSITLKRSFPHQFRDSDFLPDREFALRPEGRTRLNNATTIASLIVALSVELYLIDHLRIPENLEQAVEPERSVEPITGLPFVLSSRSLGPGPPTHRMGPPRPEASFALALMAPDGAPEPTIPIMLFRGRWHSLP